jgi:hypothetical protein
LNGPFLSQRKSRLFGTGQGDLDFAILILGVHSEKRVATDTQKIETQTAEYKAHNVNV